MRLTLNYIITVISALLILAIQTPGFIYNFPFRYKRNFDPKVISYISFLIKLSAECDNNFLLDSLSKAKIFLNVSSIFFTDFEM